MMIEKHITLKRSDGGPDSGFASEPDEFAHMVRECRIAAAACSGSFSERSTESKQYKRSLWVVKPVAAGECFTRDNIAVLRPFDGLHPSRLPKVLTERAACSIPANTPLLEVHIAG
jgi:N-acetylneuraminate synthase